MASSTVRTLAAGTVLAFAAVPAAALDVVLDGDQVILSGSMSLGDSTPWREATRNAKFKTVVLFNMPGGSIDVAMEIAEDVATRGADTVVAGFCHSACTYIFVAGRTRTLSDAWPAGRTRLGIHGTYDSVTGTASRQRAQVYAHYQRYIGEKFDSALFNSAIHVNAREQFVYFYHPAYFKGSPVQVCDGSANPSSVSCKPVAGKDAFSVGLITSLELTRLKLPARYEYQDLVLGFRMADVAPASPEQLAAACKGNATCASNFQNYATRPDDRAIVLTPTGRSATAWSFSERWLAVRRALYECSARHAETCRIAAIGDRPMARLYEVNDEETKKALAQLRGIDRASIKRAALDPDSYTVTSIQPLPPRGPTPGKVGKARELDTNQVVDVLLQEPSQAKLIDVFCGSRALPGSQCIVGAGTAYDDAAADNTLETVLAKVLANLVPDRSTRVVVFGAGPNDWRPVNAVLRFAKLGYANVEWYRGGASGWRDAGLPDVQTAPIASVVK